MPSNSQKARKSVFQELQNWRSQSSGVIHRTGMVGIAFGAIIIGMPWAFIAGGVLAGGLITYSIKSSKDVMEGGMLEEHPEKHHFSPNLQKMVDKLFHRSRLSEHKSVVHNFRVRHEKRRTLAGRAMDKALENFSLVPNAAAFDYGQPIVMISEPLLELLDDSEEYATLAHEFGHIGASHYYGVLPNKFLSIVVKTSNVIAVLNEMVNAGAIAIVLSVASALALDEAVKKGHPKGHLLSGKKKKAGDVLKDEPETLRDLHDKKDLKNKVLAMQLIPVPAIMTYFNPAYLPVFLASKGMTLGANYIEKSFVRSNEYQADRAAVVLGANPLALITALRKIDAVIERSIKEAWGVEKRPEKGALKKLWQNSVSTHPTMKRRIKRLASIAKEQGFTPAEIKQSVEGEIAVPNTVNIPIDHIVQQYKAA